MSEKTTARELQNRFGLKYQAALNFVRNNRDEAQTLRDVGEVTWKEAYSELWRRNVDHTDSADSDVTT